MARGGGSAGETRAGTAAGSAAAAGGAAAPTTPIRRQYLEIKARHPDAVLFFRLGDFYETFDADAELCHRELGIALTSKPMGKGLRVPLAGVPVHSVEQHLARLIAAGHRVAICEQLEDARATKGLVARGVVRVVSPGTALEPALLEAGSGNYCAAVWLPEEAGGGGWTAGLAAADLSTGDVRGCELTAASAAGLRASLAEELARLGVSELLTPAGTDWSGPAGPALAARPAGEFAAGRARARLSALYGVEDVEGLGLAGREALLRALGALLSYLGAAQPETEAGGGLRHLSRPRVYEPAAAMRLDAATQAALGLFADGRGGAGRGESLLGVVDRCRTAAGRRLLRERLARPLLDLAEIESRLDRVGLLVADPERRARVGAGLAAVPDLERLLGRVSAGLARPGEVAKLGAGLRAAAALADALAGAPMGAPDEAAAEEAGRGEAALLAAWRAELAPCTAAQAAVDAVLAAEPRDDFEEGEVVRPGADEELDRLRAELRTARASIAALETRERERTGIANLKVGYHRTFGYYLEVTASQQSRVPASWERRQTLAGGERYVTAELREHERSALAAREGLGARERELFASLCRELSGEAARIRALAAGAAGLDVAWALAEAAAAGGWTRPALDGSDALTIEAGRHPVVEAALGAGRFVPNDTALRADGEQVLLITGPNMAGKSTYLRQTALIVLLAQMGSFVPAASATIGLVDRIFARVGAQDDLAAGQSTFMVEMLETAAILAAATPRSLLVLDEIGRGTSTFDGLAIAQALAEHLVADPARGPRTLFATHFHELTALAGVHARIANATVAVAESAGGIEFLYRIVPGGADRSYGVHVARMAGLPAAVVARAAALLTELEGGGSGGEAAAGALDAAAVQGSLFAGPSALARELAELDVDNLTPLEAIGALYALRTRARRELGDGAGTAEDAP